MVMNLKFTHLLKILLIRFEQTHKLKKINNKAFSLILNEYIMYFILYKAFKKYFTF